MKKPDNIFANLAENLWKSGQDGEVIANQCLTAYRRRRYWRELRRFTCQIILAWLGIMVLIFASLMLTGLAFAVFAN